MGYVQVRRWQLKMLIQGVHSEKDLGLLERRHVVSLVLGFYDSTLASPMDRTYCCKLLEAMSAVPSCCHHLEQSGVVSWLFGAISNVTAADLLSFLNIATNMARTMQVTKQHLESTRSAAGMIAESELWQLGDAVMRKCLQLLSARHGDHSRGVETEAESDSCLVKVVDFLVESRCGMDPGPCCVADGWNLKLVLEFSEQTMSAVARRSGLDGPVDSNSDLKSVLHMLHIMARHQQATFLNAANAPTAHALLVLNLSLFEMLRAGFADVEPLHRLRLWQTTVDTSINLAKSVRTHMSLDRGGTRLLQLLLGTLYDVGVFSGEVVATGRDNIQQGALSALNDLVFTLMSSFDVEAKKIRLDSVTQGSNDVAPSKHEAVRLDAVRTHGELLQTFLNNLERHQKTGTKGNNKQHVRSSMSALREMRSAAKRAFAEMLSTAAAKRKKTQSGSKKSKKAKAKKK